MKGVLVVAFWLEMGVRYGQVRCITSVLASMTKFGDYQSIEIENLKKQVELLSVFVAGCEKHPAYRVILPTTGNCETCVKI